MSLQANYIQNSRGHRMLQFNCIRGEGKELWKVKQGAYVQASFSTHQCIKINLLFSFHSSMLYFPLTPTQDGRKNLNDFNVASAIRWLHTDGYGYHSLCLGEEKNMDSSLRKLIITQENQVLLETPRGCLEVSIKASRGPSLKSASKDLFLKQKPELLH